MLLSAVCISVVSCFEDAVFCFLSAAFAVVQKAAMQAVASMKELIFFIVCKLF